VESGGVVRVPIGGPQPPGGAVPPILSTLEVKCRPLNNSVADLARALHCYIVTKERNQLMGQTFTQTISRGEATGNFVGYLDLRIVPYEPLPPNRVDDMVVYQASDGQVGIAIGCVERVAGHIQDNEHITYVFLGPNSNSFVYTALFVCGRNLVLPGDAVGGDRLLPGWEHFPGQH
jgi:hypothetical protein